MSKYDNEKKLVEQLVNNYTHIVKTQKYIKETFDVDSTYDKNVSTLYIWNENGDLDTLSQAKQYIDENIEREFIDIDMYHPDKMFESADEYVYVVYLEDGTMYNLFYNEKDADDAIEKLKSESPANKPTKKKEQVSNYIKNENL